MLNTNLVYGSNSVLQSGQNPLPSGRMPPDENGVFITCSPSFEIVMLVCLIFFSQLRELHTGQTKFEKNCSSFCTAGVIISSCLSSSARIFDGSMVFSM